MLTRFDGNKKYVFDRDTALTNDSQLKDYYNTGHSQLWVDYCNGKQVEDLSEYTGFVKYYGCKLYLISPEWCKELEG